jgi:hypothetical protein
VIYVDTSVVLAELLAENATPPAALWRESLVASRLLEYEVWTRLNARALGNTHSEAARLLIGRLSLLELSRTVLARALDPFPVVLRTLDALHLASADFLRASGQSIALASYDQRLVAAARALKIGIYKL